MNNLIKAVIFDFDGVIVDSAHIKTGAFGELFSKYPEHKEAIIQHHLDNQGISRFRKFEWIYENLLKKKIDQKISTELSDRFTSIVKDKIYKAAFMEGALELLGYLKTRSACKLFIASGTPDAELIDIIINRAPGFFDEVWGSSRDKIIIIQDILNRYNLQPENVLFLGDASSDYVAAVTAGLHFSAVYSENMEYYWKEKNVKPVYNLTDLIHRFTFQGIPASEKVDA